MLSPANAWPVLLTTLRNKPRILNKHIVNTKHNTDQLLNHIDKNQAKALKALIDFVKFIQELVIEAL